MSPEVRIAPGHATPQAARSRLSRAARLLAILFTIAACCFLSPGSGELGTPQQIHLSWSEPATDRLTVTWVTNTRAAGSRVLWGGPSDSTRVVRKATSAPLADDPGLYVHSAHLGPLTPGEGYSYVVGSDSSGWSSAHPLRSSGGADSEVTFTATADTDVEEGLSAGVAQMAKAEPAFVLHAGDLSYASNHPWRWNQFFRKYQVVAARAPLMAALGNHEHDALMGLSSYFARLVLPGNERYYSFDYGPIHVVALDSGATYEAPSAEITAWLEDDLRRSADNPANPWKVVFFHFPPFSSGGHGSWQEGREAWGALFDRYGVDLVINGHDHSFERSWPVFSVGSVAQRHYVRPGAPVYVVTGGGGAPLYRFPSLPPEWSAFRASGRQTLRVTAGQFTMKIVAVRHDGAEMDSFELIR